MSESRIAPRKSASAAANETKSSSRGTAPDEGKPARKRAATPSTPRVRKTAIKSAKPAARKSAATTASAPGTVEGEASVPDTLANVSPEERRRMIERIAYFRAEWRGWTPGHELDDWLHAEHEVDAMLRGRRAE